MALVPKRILLAGAAGAALLAIGCGGEALPPAVAVAAKPAPAAGSKAAAPDDTPQPTPADDPEVVYQPPFPQRTNMFAPTRRKPVAERVNTASGESVVLKGFATIDEPKVLLSIDGVMTALTAEAEHAGVRVISIDPPQAVLQRGRSRWTAKLSQP